MSNINMWEQFPGIIRRGNLRFKLILVAETKDLPLLEAEKNKLRYRDSVIVHKDELGLHALYQEMWLSEHDFTSWSSGWREEQYRE